MIRFGVLGWPVAHSRSPRMHAAAYAALGLEGWRYLPLGVPPEALAETVRALPAAGFRGVNVTIPHKQAALALADAASPAARAIGAANTLTFTARGVEADNTDAPGLLEALAEDPAGRTALVLGAGGSARAAVHALAGAGAEVTVWNRTHERAERLAADFGVTAARDPQPAQITVNCTAVGLDGSVAALKALPSAADALRHGCTLVDLVYRDGGTPLTRRARDQGARVVDGLAVLVAQGALSFERWTGMTAPREIMWHAVRTD